jgi:hypothetical protein
VYVEKSDGTKGTPLWEGIIQRDEKRSIDSPTERIIFNYRFNDEDQWKEDVHAWCHNNDEVKVP